MKVEQILQENDSIGKILEENQQLLLEDITEYGEGEVTKLEQGYEELKRLDDALRSGDFGHLIGKEGQELTDEDIERIRFEITDILDNNYIIGSKDDGDGRQRLRILGKKVEEGLNASILAILTGVFSVIGYKAFGFSLASAGAIGAGGTLAAISPLGVAFGTLLAVGGVLSGAAITLGAIGLSVSMVPKFFKKTESLKHLKSASKAIAISDAVAEGGDQRNFFQRAWDFILRTNPKDIYDKSREKLQGNSQEARKRIDQLVEDLPQIIHYREEATGEEKDVSIEYLFKPKN